MKRFSLLLVSAVYLLTSCDKEVNVNATYTYTDPNFNAYIKFINAYPYATPVFAGQATASFQLTYNGVQFSATPIGLGASFPANPNYAAINRNTTQREMFVRLGLGIPPAATRDSFLFAFTPSTTVNKYYSYFLCDSINNPNTRLLVTEDDVQDPGGANLYRLRFINLIPNMRAGTAPTLDLFSTAARAVIFTGIPARGVTPFLEIPVRGTNTPDTLQIRYTGSTTPLATLNGLPVVGQGSFTVFARGFIGAAGARAPGVSFYRNR